MIVVHKKYDLIRNRIKLLRAFTFLKQNKHKSAVDMFYQVIEHADKSRRYDQLYQGIEWPGMGTDGTRAI